MKREYFDCIWCGGKKTAYYGKGDEDRYKIEIYCKKCKGDWEIDDTCYFDWSCEDFGCDRYYECQKEYDEWQEKKREVSEFGDEGSPRMDTREDYREWRKEIMEQLKLK